MILVALIFLMLMVSAQPVASEPVSKVNLLVVFFVGFLLLIVVSGVILFRIRENKNIGGIKGGVIGFVVGLVVSGISSVTGVGILFGIPFAALFCDRLYSCKEEWEGMLPSMIIGLVVLTLIFIVVGVIIGKASVRKV